MAVKCSFSGCYKPALCNWNKNKIETRTFKASVNQAFDFFGLCQDKTSLLYKIVTKALYNIDINYMDLHWRCTFCSSEEAKVVSCILILNVFFSLWIIVVVLFSLLYLLFILREKSGRRGSEFEPCLWWQPSMVGLEFYLTFTFLTSFLPFRPPAISPPIRLSFLSIKKKKNLFAWFYNDTLSYFQSFKGKLGEAPFVCGCCVTLGRNPQASN